MAHSLPTRLFKLDAQAVRKASDDFDFASGSIGKLYDQTDLAKLQSCSYCAISHVWGKSPAIITVTGIPWGVPVARDKLLFILKACEQRGYEYIWLDILCINQTRGAPESTIEMSKMQQYYKEAHVTIVFGAELRQFASNWEKVDGIIRRWGGYREDAISANSEDLGQVDKIVMDSWFWRVWTLQEAVIPLTTSPLDTIVADPAPYNRARLLTPNGMPMDLRGLCDFIDWTNVALAKLNYVDQSARYPWIRPGNGEVNHHHWWRLGALKVAIGLGAAKLHPLEAVRMTMHREVSPNHLADCLKGLYGLIDKKWHFLVVIPDDKRDDKHYELVELWKKMSNKYVDEGEAEVLLLCMAVNNWKDPKCTWGAKRTWAAGAGLSDISGNFIPQYGCHAVQATVENDSLKLKAGISEIRVVSETSYGDGSGELMRLIPHLFDLQNDSVDTSSIFFLLKSAINQAELTDPNNDTLEIRDIDTFMDLPISTMNALSSGLRSVFAGWDRWIISLADMGNKAFLAWFPYREADANIRLSKCSVLRLKDDDNEWGVIVEREAIVENQPPSYRKVGVVFLHSTTTVIDSKEVVIL